MIHSFEELCLPCYEELVRFADKRVRNEAKARDIVQDAMVRALAAWPEWVPQGNPVIWARAWMFRIVANTLVTMVTRESHFVRLTNCHYTVVGDVSDAGPAGEKSNSRRAGPAKLAISDQVAGELHQELEVVHPYMRPESMGDEVREALDRIKPEWAEIVVLVYLEGVPEPEVARRLGLARGTVRSRMARGRMALARILGPYAKQRFGYSLQAREADHQTLDVTGGADEAADQLQPAELEQADADRVQGIVAEHDAGAFGFV